MKRIKVVLLLVFLLMVTTGCSFNQRLDPPGWLYGTWAQDGTHAWIVSDQTFSLVYGSTVTSLSGMADRGERFSEGSAPGVYTVTHLNTGARYTFTLSGDSLDWSVTGDSPKSGSYPRT